MFRGVLGGHDRVESHSVVVRGEFNWQRDALVIGRFSFQRCGCWRRELHADLTMLCLKGFLNLSIDTSPKLRFFMTIRN
jgi:hypothetical protein